MTYRHSSPKPKQACYATIGHAYPTSHYAETMGHSDSGCWLYYTCDVNFDCIDGSETGPYPSGKTALDAMRAAYPSLPIPPGHRDWIAWHADAASTYGNSDHAYVA